MRIEFLYWEECPSHPEALALLEEVLAERGIAAGDDLSRIAP